MALEENTSQKCHLCASKDEEWRKNYKSSKLILCDQAEKGCWWMPWHQKAKKDAKPAKSFGELEKAMTRRCPNGETRWE